MILPLIGQYDECSHLIGQEGAPCPPEPPSTEWTPDPCDFYQEGARIEAAFRKYVHR